MPGTPHDPAVTAFLARWSHAQSAEDAKGIIRWLRPEYQKPLFAGTKQASRGLEDSGT